MSLANHLFHVQAHPQNLQLNSQTKITGFQTRSGQTQFLLHEIAADVLHVATLCSVCAYAAICLPGVAA